MISFELSEEQQMIRDTVGAFARDEIRPAARPADEDCTIPPELVAKAWQLGLVRSPIPAQFGGDGDARAAVTGAVIAEELAYGDLSVAIDVLAPRLFAFPLLEMGTADQKKRYLPRLSGKEFVAASAAVMEPKFDFDLDRAGDCRHARRTADSSSTARSASCRWPKRPRRSWCSRPRIRKRALRVSTGLSWSAALVALRLASARRTWAFKGVETYELELKGCRLGPEARLGGERGCNFTRLTSQWRVALAAMAVGVARASFEYARDYAKERKAFGVPIATKQAIAFMLADMAIEIDAIAPAGMGSGVASRQGRGRAQGELSRQELRGCLGAEDRPTTPCRCWAATATSASIRSRCGCATRAASRRSKVSRRFKQIKFRTEIDDDRLRIGTTSADAAADVPHGRPSRWMRPISREYDEREHEHPWKFWEMMWAASRESDLMGTGRDAPDGKRPGGAPRPSRSLNAILSTEELCWGDAGLFLSIPNSGLGGAAVMAAGTPQQKERFLKRFREGKPKWGAMAITEPGCGSDSAAVTTTAARDRRLLGNQRHQDFLHRRRDGSRQVRRLRGGLGDGRQDRRPRRNQAVRGRAQHAGHDRGHGSRTSSEFAPPTPRRSC